MTDDTRRVLELLAQGKITVDEADQLLRALRGPAATDDATPPPNTPRDPANFRHLRINVQKTGVDGRRDKDVNIRVPISVVRGGLRLGAIIPGFSERMSAKLRERLNVDLSTIDANTIESLLKDFGELNIDVNQGRETVRITCE
jgi:SHOCT-like domain